MTDTTSIQFCTGIYCHFTALSKDWHGQFGHINTAKPDNKSYITGYGKHQRVIVFNDYLRVDLKWDLPEPTIAQIKAVIATNYSTKNMSLVEISRDDRIIEFSILR